MARNKTLYLYNDTKVDQDWHVYSEGVINQRTKVGQTRKTYTISLSGPVTIHWRRRRCIPACDLQLRQTPGQAKPTRPMK